MPPDAQARPPSGPGRPIEIFNRYTQGLETEKIYGERALRWAYESSLGRCTVEILAKRPFLSSLYGLLMSRPASRDRILPFIEAYGLDTSEFADPPDSFDSFNEFFFRRLKPEARPICGGDDEVAFPADGRHLSISDVGREDAFFVKGQRFDLEALLGCAELAERYAGGCLVLSRLCPVDYHRYHFAVPGTATAPRHLDGPLYSVSPVALRRNLDYLWRNKRALTEIDTARSGKVLQVEIGATNVGSIRSTFSPGAVGKGDEKGYFAFGGSATITLFEAGAVALADDLSSNSARGRELYAHMGDVMATLV
jgi:phosphatidylserine decarboxylase